MSQNSLHGRDSQTATLKSSHASHCAKSNGLSIQGSSLEPLGLQRDHANSTLHIQDAVRVFSQSADAWVDGVVTNFMHSFHVRVEYDVGQHHCGKVLRMNSKCLEVFSTNAESNGEDSGQCTSANDHTMTASVQTDCIGILDDSNLQLILQEAGKGDLTAQAGTEGQERGANAAKDSQTSSANCSTACIALQKFSVCMTSIVHRMSQFRRAMPISWTWRVSRTSPKAALSTSACFGPSALNSWRLTRQELQRLLDNYESVVEHDAATLFWPTKKEHRLLGDAVIQRRAEMMRVSREANRQFVNMMLEDLPTFPDGLEAVPSPCRPVAKVKCVDPSTLRMPDSQYGSLACLFMHFFRDWSTACNHVVTSTYTPVVEELQALLLEGGDVLVPGAGLGRLALELAAAGFLVEANDASRLFCTAADYLLNRAPASGMTLFPLAHNFSDNWSLAQQYTKAIVPMPSPAAVAKSEDTSRASRSPTPAIALVPGDFMQLYRKGGPGYRQFSAIVTSFFIDTAVDLIELVEVMDELLPEGGVWVNIGPLKWRHEARIKLSNDEIIALWENMGYEFVSRKQVDCDYHMQHGIKMSNESYHCSLTTAVKRRSNINAENSF